MIKVKNQKAVRNLADKSFRANRVRNLIAVIAIAMTSVLFTALFTLGTGVTESVQNAQMHMYGGSYQGVFKYLTKEQFDSVQKNPHIREVSYAEPLCDDLVNEELTRRRAEFWYYDKKGLKYGYCEPTSGHIPEKENEIIADTQTLYYLGVSLKAGEPVSLKMMIHGKEVTRNFILSGWWKSNPAFNVGQIFASKAYVDRYADELVNRYYQDGSMAGTINAYFMFLHDGNLMDQLNRISKECGFSEDEKDKNHVDSNVNPAYISTNFNMDPQIILALVSGLLLAAFAGYLIIYNIFQISVIRDIRFYGMLKTIGTTGRQLRKIIRRQAGMLSVLGIPLGLLIGFFIGKGLLPFIMKLASYSGDCSKVSPSVWIFIGAAVFSFITVFISTWKPGRIASKVSPIEALRYTDGGKTRKRTEKKSRNGAKMSKMALSNLGRNKKQTVLVILSLSLSLVLLDCVFTISKGVDMNKLLQSFYDTDFLLAHADYFNNGYFGVKEHEISESFIQVAESQDGFEKGGRIYENIGFSVLDKNYKQVFNVDDDGNPMADVYGMEQLPYERLKMLKGEKSLDKLKSGNYILEGVKLDDNGKPEWGKTPFEVGDKVKIHYYQDDEIVTKNYTILGMVEIHSKTNSNRSFNPYTFYLPSEIYKELVPAPITMSYSINVKNGKEAEVEKFLKNYVENTEPQMNYSSKKTVVKQFDGLRQMIIMVGGMLSLIIGLIGILNFINSMLTSILARKKEFAMLNSIGMTRKQLIRMLCFEGIYYTGFTALATLVLSVVFSLIVVRGICAQIWFMNYQFVISPVLICIPILLILGILVPYVEYGATDKQSIVERLREAQ